MSLINEALKKAQRQRTGEQFTDSPPLPGGSPSYRHAGRGQGMPAQTLILIIAGATVLITLSVVATVWLTRSEPAPATKAVIVSAPVVQPASPPAEPAPSPVIIAPLIRRPAPAVEYANPKPAMPDAPANSFAAAKLGRVTDTMIEKAPERPAPASETAPPEEPAVSGATVAAPGVPDIRVQNFVDAVRVTGIRSSGSDSKVLMNDRVYRVNDIVERTLGVRLVKVAPDSLTFADANGVTYLKYF